MNEYLEALRSFRQWELTGPEKDRQRQTVRAMRRVLQRELDVIEAEVIGDGPAGWETKASASPGELAPGNSPVRTHSSDDDADMLEPSSA
jgi:hypothetical protein